MLETRLNWHRAFRALALAPVLGPPGSVAVARDERPFLILLGGGERTATLTRIRVRAILLARKRFYHCGDDNSTPGVTGFGGLRKDPVNLLKRAVASFRVKEEDSGYDAEIATHLLVLCGAIAWSWTYVTAKKIYVL